MELFLHDPVSQRAFLPAVEKFYQSMFPFVGGSWHAVDVRILLTVGASVQRLSSSHVPNIAIMSYTSNLPSDYVVKYLGLYISLKFARKATCHTGVWE